MPVARRRNYWIQQSIKDQTFDNKYSLGKEIGRGRSSIIYSCERRALKQTWAVKILKKNPDKKLFVADIGTLLGLDHVNLVRLQEIFESKTRIYIIEDIVYGGELFDRIPTLSVYTEIVAGKAIKDIASGINYLHNCGYILKNLKPENLLYATIYDDSRLVIADFAKTSICDVEVDMSCVCGYPEYTAPEVLKGEHCKKPGDMWSVGVILFILLCGYEPFSSDNPSQLFKKILKGQYNLVREDWELISLNAQSIMKKLLVLDPESRLTASALLRSVWVQGSVLKPYQLTDVVMRIKNFNIRRKEKLCQPELEVQTIHPNINPRYLLYVKN